MRQTLDFLLYRWLKVDRLSARERFSEHSRETFDAVLELAEQIATNLFEPHNRKADENEPRFVDGRVSGSAPTRRTFSAAGTDCDTFAPGCCCAKPGRGASTARMSVSTAQEDGTARTRSCARFRRVSRSMSQLPRGYRFAACGDSLR